MFCIYAAGKAVDGSVFVTLGLEKTTAAGENQVCSREKLCFGGTKTGGSSAKSGQLVHAVIDSDSRFKLASEIQRQRCVVPENRTVGGRIGREELLQHALLDREYVLWTGAVREVGNCDGY